MAAPRPRAKPAAKNIVWLASYPKSGNTWTRIFLANYLFDRKEPMPINQVHRLGMGDSIAKAYAMVAGAPVNTADHKAMLGLRPRVLRGIAGNGADVNFVKTHNIRDFAMGTELIPVPLTRSAVYILRNPLDVVLSYARHYDKTPAEAVAAIARDDNTTAGDATSVPQYLGNWSRHVKSWTERAPFPVLVLRYEDLQDDPETGFSRLLEHLGFTPDPERLARAIRFSAFDEVARQETDKGFIEKSPTAERFFSRGTAGQWQSDLDPELVEAVRKVHGPVMRAHGYL
ncbi:sulfotransferase domain-containing protein [Paralimibaculum aggregatum]|uniref:Sulfotransferase domain-containing protein n=1 Tax=Paralimibaculum aggregatum TaxID=3036245 RepID=A0ABQ6LTG9_9RHOB|nr:sulfotransferase domain-containing protein [Limibaculum sp. NKW23]GMG85365.1 sulfotransferase domain-containing protein [Limibaculum sp. NKW23]